MFQPHATKIHEKEEEWKSWTTAHRTSFLSSLPAHTSLYPNGWPSQRSDSPANNLLSPPGITLVIPTILSLSLSLQLMAPTEPERMALGSGKAWKGNQATCILYPLGRSSNRAWKIGTQGWWSNPGHQADRILLPSGRAFCKAWKIGNQEWCTPARVTKPTELHHKNHDSFATRPRLICSVPINGLKIPGLPNNLDDIDFGWKKRYMSQYDPWAPVPVGISATALTTSFTLAINLDKVDTLSSHKSLED